MEAVALSTVIKKTIETAMVIGSEEISRSHNRLREDAKWIETEMKLLLSYFTNVDSEHSQRQDVMTLREAIRELAHDVEDTVDIYFPQINVHSKKDFLAHLKTVACCFSNWRINHQFFMKIKGIRRRVEEIKVARDALDVPLREDDVNREVWQRRSLFLSRDNQNVVGFEQHISKLEPKLFSVETKYDVISITGTAGLGKTTVAKRIFNYAKTRRAIGNSLNVLHFECSAFVYVSQAPNVDELLKKIAEQVGLEWETREQNLANNLSSFLSQKRYVLFLDDIWNTNTWDDLKTGFPDNPKSGSRIIITSRYSAVGRYTGGTLYELDPLDFEKCWKIFCKEVMDPLNQRNEDYEIKIPSHLDGTGRKIVDKCGGMPLAVVVMAGMLRHKGLVEHAWITVLDSMGPDENNEIAKILALSYNDLPCELKIHFLYFGLFPKKFEIHAFKIINMWVAENFISANQAEIKGLMHLQELADRNLIEVASTRIEGRIKTCRIHDLLHNLCVQEAKKSNFFHILKNAEDSSVTRLRRLAIGHEGVGACSALNSRTTKLRSLLFFNDSDNWELLVRQVKDNLLDFRLLHVLYLEYNGGDGSSFLTHIGKLMHLRYLQLRGSFKGIPASGICNLRNLLTLDVSSSDILLPSSIWRMKLLRHFLLSDAATFTSTTKLCILKSLKSPLPSLETLCMVHGPDLDPCWIPQFSNLKHLGISNATDQIVEVLSGANPILHSLKKLCLRYLHHTQKLNLSPYSNLLELRLVNLDRMLDLDDFPPNLTKLTLHAVKSADILETPKKLPKLKIFKLKHNPIFLMDCSGVDCFPQLEVLELSYLENLTGLIADEIGMPNLKKVIIGKGCQNLTRIEDRVLDVTIRRQ